MNANVMMRAKPAPRMSAPSFALAGATLQERSCKYAGERHFLWYVRARTDLGHRSPKRPTHLQEFVEHLQASRPAELTVALKETHCHV
eukprot:scaffold224609_cov22-Tisochrysis_lutea.AAC.1